MCLNSIYICAGAGLAATQIAAVYSRWRVCSRASSRDLHHCCSRALRTPIFATTAPAARRQLSGWHRRHHAKTLAQHCLSRGLRAHRAVGLYRCGACLHLCCGASGAGWRENVAGMAAAATRRRHFSVGVSALRIAISTTTRARDGGGA